MVTQVTVYLDKDGYAHAFGLFSILGVVSKDEYGNTNRHEELVGGADFPSKELLKEYVAVQLKVGQHAVVIED